MSRWKEWVCRTLLLTSSVLMLTGCKSVQIFVEKPATEATLVSTEELQREVFYVKEGTKFASVYMPSGNADKAARRLVTSRIMYMAGDEAMVPTHYKGEALAYCSADTKIKQNGITLERFKDLGYSVGLYGGTVEADGYYHMEIKKNVANGSSAQEILNHSRVNDVRIVSIGGKKPEELVDSSSGIFIGLEKDKKYTIEFYLGTYYYTQDFTADTHFLRAYEFYSYDSDKILDTKLSYVTFETPEDLKSGYYNVNGQGIFKYYAYAKGSVPEEVDMNEGYYENEMEQIKQYTRRYDLNIPKASKDVQIDIIYGDITDGLDNGSDIGAYLISPEGVIYEFNIVENNNLLTATLKQMMQGNWSIHVYPRSLTISSIKATEMGIQEETTCEEYDLDVAEPFEYQAIYADVTGEGQVNGTIIAEDGKTYQMQVVEYKDADRKTRRYLICKFPYLSVGSYKVKIYHYKSQTIIDNVQIISYNADNGELIIN